MGLLRLTLLVLATVLYVKCTDEHVPMVAFMCNRPAMYLSKTGWIKDDSTDCLADPAQVLNYCRKVYPGLDVRNVVESSAKVTIEKWCGFGHNKCHHKFTVRPFRCLVGPFQSDALLVPEHCLFDHIHEPRKCKSYNDWNTTSAHSCLERGMVQQSFAILQPCGIDKFNGVEFVCCPEEDDVDEFLRKEFSMYSSTTSTTTSTTTTTVPPTTPTQPPTKKPIDMSHDDLDDMSFENVNDIYNQYLHNVRGKYLSEHEYFTKAKNDLQKHHHEKVTKMMKEWAEARNRVQGLKSQDPKGSEKLNREITTRFQKTYEALEQEGMAEKKQLISLHQQRIQAMLNEKKRHAMEHFMEVLTNDQADATQILKALRHYVKSEEKDRLHSVNHFKHLRDTDPAEAEAESQQVLDHLQIIDQRIQQAIDMLNRVPKYEKKIRATITKYLETFHPIDVTIDNILRKPIAVSKEESLDKYKQAFATGGESKEVDDGDDDDEEDDEEEDDDEEADEEEEVEKSAVPAPTPAPTQPPKEPSTLKLHRVAIAKAPAMEVSTFDDEVMEDEHAEDFVDVKQAHVAHIQHSELSVQQKSFNVESHPIETISSSGTTLAIAVGSITVFAIVVVGIVVMRKRARGLPPTTGFVEVDQAASPEERHVANMQVNGYENPTYKYFEMNHNA